MTIDAQIDNDPLLTEGVSRELARSRVDRVSAIRYKLRLELRPGADRFKGRQEIRFKLTNTKDDLILDFRDLDASGKSINGTVAQVKANDKLAIGLRQINGHVVLPGNLFNLGENKLQLEFETGAATAGRPIIRYKDADDGSEYLHTLLVPMDAHLAFPCFDQPDLKARFTFSAVAPKDWTIVSNMREEGVGEFGQIRETQFAETEAISTYLFAFAAGPFKILGEDGASTPPLRFLVRQSKLERAREELPEIDRLTRAGLSHMVEYFGHRFPFSKYDQVLIPGFAYGGMEHAGATFLREDSILFRSVPTVNDRYSRASLILHELAHQWFGDLVTMRWFDDLWLKEGFANYMAFHALASIYEPDEVWKRFYLAHKPLAYGIDATRGTTPIYQEIRNLKDAKSAYGAIVYQKAPSLLHAMSFLIGEDNFRDGVRAFLKRHAYANAEWSDLIGAFEKSSNQKLEVWANAWVKRRGMPQINVDWSCSADGNIDRFELRQHDSLGEGRAWPTKSRVLLAYDDAEPVRFTAQIEGPRVVVPEAVGKRCPVYVFANDHDYGYGRFLLDAKSREAVIARMSRIKEPFLRTMLWGALWDAVREAEMKPTAYLDLAIASLPAERDESLIQSTLARASHAYQRYLAPAEQSRVAPQFELLLSDLMMTSTEQGLRILYFRAFRSLASTEPARSKLKQILSGKFTIPGVEIKPLDRWQILTRLIAGRDPEAFSLLDAERKRDATDDGRKQAYIAEAARAETPNKQKYFDDYLKNRAIPEDWIEGSLASFNSGNQSDLTLPFLKPALEALPQVKRERKIFFLLAWLNGFLGGQQSPEALAQVQAFLKSTPLDRDLELKTLEVMDELERTVRIRAR